MGDTAIEWTDVTWNPVRGCSKVSPGCANCYAERTAARQAHSGYKGLVRIGEGSPRWTGEVRLVPEKLGEPLSWRKPRRIFVNSMSDLFHEMLTNEQIAEVFATMALAEDQTFQVLTKRAARAKDWFAWAAAQWPKLHSLTAIQDMRQNGHGPDSNIVLTYARNERVLRRLAQVEDDFAAPWPLPNVWLGVSVENQAVADERIPLLLETPAAVRFLSVEPLLGPVNLAPWLRFHTVIGDDDQPEVLGGRIDWVIVGGESGPGARPCARPWIRSIVEQCKAAGVACFVKQLGADSRIVPNEHWGEGVQQRMHSKKGGDPAEWPEDLRVRQFPEVRP